MSVQFSEMRARLRQAVDALCDRDLHERLWLRGQRTSPSELAFDDALLFLGDELEMFGSADLVGNVLIDDSELVAFTDLASTVETLIQTVGKRGSFRDALASGPPWESVEQKAREMQLLLNRASHEG